MSPAHVARVTTDATRSCHYRCHPLVSLQMSPARVTTDVTCPCHSCHSRCHLLVSLVSLQMSPARVTRVTPDVTCPCHSRCHSCHSRCHLLVSLVSLQMSPARVTPDVTCSCHSCHSRCHLPVLYIGLEYGLTHNLKLASRFFSQALSIAPHDPFVLHEIGVVAFHNREWVAGGSIRTDLRIAVPSASAVSPAITTHFTDDNKRYVVPSSVVPVCCDYLSGWLKCMSVVTSCSQWRYKFPFRSHETSLTKFAASFVRQLFFVLFFQF